jgi:hypothetical protein
MACSTVNKKMFMSVATYFPKWLSIVSFRLYSCHFILISIFSFNFTFPVSLKLETCCIILLLLIAVLCLRNYYTNCVPFFVCNKFLEYFAVMPMLNNCSTLSFSGAPHCIVHLCYPCRKSFWFWIFLILLLILLLCPFHVCFNDFFVSLLFGVTVES